jgi:hypothetical protein
MLRGWTPKEKGEASILEEWHIDDKPCTGRPKISLALYKFIITTVTKNSTTRQWSYAHIASKVSVMIHIITCYSL